MITQRLILADPPEGGISLDLIDKVWSCPGCGTQLEATGSESAESVLEHDDSCSEMARVREAERERIAAELTRRADDLGELAGDDPRTHDLRLIATTLRNTAWAITHGDEGENLREPAPGDQP